MKSPQLPFLRGEPWAPRSDIVCPRPRNLEHGGVGRILPQVSVQNTAHPLRRRDCLKFLPEDVAELPFLSLLFSTRHEEWKGLAPLVVCRWAESHW